MTEYNTYGTGKGGVCASVWDPSEPSYWCGNSSSGGWAEVDRQAAAAGQLGIPRGFTFNATYTERYACSFDDHNASCTSQVGCLVLVVDVPWTSEHPIASKDA